MENLTIIDNLARTEIKTLNLDLDNGIMSGQRILQIGVVNKLISILEYGNYKRLQEIKDLKQSYFQRARQLSIRGLE